MALKIGQIVPSFDLPSTEGGTISASDLKGTPYILYFYPRDYTPGCTAEACSFRDNFEEFRDLDITIYGVSTDSIEQHNKFRESYALPFHLLSDPDGKVARKFGASIPFVGMSRRITYLIGPDERIKAVYNSLFNAKGHIKSMIKAVKSAGT